jgi:hypothetical protein
MLITGKKYPTPSLSRSTCLAGFLRATRDAENTENYKRMGFESLSNALHWLPCKAPDIKTDKPVLIIRALFLSVRFLDPIL